LAAGPLSEVAKPGVNFLSGGYVLQDIADPTRSTDSNGVARIKLRVVKVEL
jgi:hypothetical protein